MVDVKGWMAKQAFIDYDVRQPQDYFIEDPYFGLYVESSYVLTYDMDEAGFIGKYLDIYMVFDYAEDDYAE